MDPDDELALGASGSAARRLPDDGVRRCRPGDRDRLRPGRARPGTGTRTRTRRSCASTRCPPRSTSTSSPPSSSSVTCRGASSDWRARPSVRHTPPAPRGCETPCASACAAPTTTPSRRCNHPGSSSSFGERSGSGTSSSPTSGSTSSGSAGCSPRTNRTRSSSRTAWPRWASPSRRPSPRSWSTPTATWWRSAATAGS